MGPAAAQFATREWAEEFERRGVGGPFSIFGEAEASRLADDLARAPAPDTWAKGCAVTSPRWFDVATRPGIVERVAAVLGDDVMLCGANMVERIPDQVHPWHVDAHLVDPAGRAVTVWIGLRNVHAGSSLRVVPGSHRFGYSPEQRAAEADRGALDLTDDDVLAWARRADPDASLLTVASGPGEAVFIDGATWHGTRNDTAADRVAIVLHYATPDTPVRLHGPIERYPHRLLDEPRPPCVMVRGSDSSGVNRIVPSPARPGEQLSRVFETGPIFEDASTDWSPDPLFWGSTRSLSFLSVKALVEERGNPLHEIHHHAAEQITLAIDGGARMWIGQPRPIDVGLEANSFIYVPPGTFHVAQTDNGTRARHIDVAWIGESGGAPVPLGFGICSLDDVEPDRVSLDERGRSAVELRSGPTPTLERLRILRIDMLPGFVDADDVDAYDAIVVVVRGWMETLGRTLGPGDVAMYCSGEPHTMAVVGDEPVLLLAVELHSTYVGQPLRTIRRAIVSRLPRRVRMSVRKVRDKITGRR